MMIREAPFAGATATVVKARNVSITATATVASTCPFQQALDPSPHPLRAVYYRRGRELLLMAAGISNARSMGPLDTNLL
jgi:hypothetical protein